MTGPDDRERDAYSQARNRIALGLFVVSAILSLLDPLPGYDTNVGLVIVLLGVCGLMVGVDAIDRRLPK